MVGAILGLSRRLGPEALAIGFVGGAVLQIAVQLPIALRAGLLRFVRPAWSDPILARLRSLAAPVVVSSLIVQALFMVDKMMGSLLDEGSVSVLGYATTVNMLTLQVFAGTLVTVLFTDLAALIARGDMAGFREAFRRDTRYLLAMIVPFAAIAAARSGEIISVLFERGRFDESATRMTSHALVMYSVGLPVLGINMLLGRVFHALKEMRARMIIDFAWLATNVLVNLALIRPLGVSGIALGTSAAAAVNVVLAVIYLRKRHGGVGEGAAARTFLESIAAGVVMGLAILWVPESWPWGPDASRLARAGSLALVGTAGMGVYGGVLLAFRQLGRRPRLPVSD
jgi:putative peptidoglycan lipid II flippase